MSSALAQYDWSQHLGPRPTGFERVRFGSWDLEIRSLRGMVDREYYEADDWEGHEVRSFTETTRGVGANGDPTGPVFRRSRATMDSRGRVKRIEYEDPLTRKTIQRETFAYDSEGRLVQWSRSRPPSEVTVASITRTQYPGTRPYGMAQTFAYGDDGSLLEWRACTIVTNQQLQDCKDDYLKLDSAGRIIEFGWSGEMTSIKRDVHGNARSIRVQGVGDGGQYELLMSADGEVLLEMEGDDVRGRTFFDDRGNLVQYQAMSAESPGYYATVTWTYDDADRVSTIAKAFDSFSFSRDESGRVVEVDQTVIPRSVRLKFDEVGRITVREPPLFFRRMSSMAMGSETFQYDADGLLTQIAVSDSSGTRTARTEFRYARRRLSARAASRRGG